MRKKVVRIVADGGYYLVGSLLYALSVNVFTAPNRIAPGGLTGIGTLLNYLWQVPIGAFIVLGNLPLFLWGGRVFGGRFLIKSAVATVLSSVLIDVTGLFLPAYQGDNLLAALFGGVLAGGGLALIFMRGATTGGTDLAAQILRKKFRRLSQGKMMLGIDLLIVILSAFVYRSIETPLYAVVVIYVTTKVVDVALYGVDSGNGMVMWIVSQKSDEIGCAITRQAGRGVTALPGRGVYSGQSCEVLLCAAWRQETYKLYDIIYAIDDEAFVIVGEAGEIRGEGFSKFR